MSGDGLITVCVLGFGEHVDLFRRCTDSIAACLPDRQHVAEVRVGLNVPGAELNTAMDTFAGSIMMDVGHVYRVDGAQAKYPTMRTLIYGGGIIPPITTEFVIWFDDDSYLKEMPKSRYRELKFFDSVERAGCGFDLMGAPYTIRLRPGQAEWIRAQPWYAGVPFHEDGPGRAVVKFFTGGWWFARTDRLREWDYPWPALYHNGGDVMLGELAHQQGWRTRPYKVGVAINADDQGRESKAPRRGLNTLPIGATS